MTSEIVDPLRRPEVADWLLRLAVPDVTRRVRVDGRGTVPALLKAALFELQQAAQSPSDFASETPSSGPVTVVIGVREKAERMGASEQYVRRLCRSGELPAWKIGRDWLISETEGDSSERTGDQEP